MATKLASLWLLPLLLTSSWAGTVSKQFALHVDPADQGGLSVPLTVQELLYPAAPTSGIARTRGPVTVGIPLPPNSGITSTSQLGLTGASAGQFRAESKYPNGNLHFVLIDTLADVPADGQNTGITLTTGSGNFGGPNLATDNGATISVDT